MPRSVVYATDGNYWMPLYVSVFSMLKNNKNTSFRIYVICEKEDEEFVSYLSYLDRVHHNHKIEFIEIDSSTFSDAPEPEWFSRGIYYRLLVDSVLPVKNDNVLYMDCDTLVIGSVDELFNQDLSNSIAAAVPEFNNRAFWKGFPADATHYNTGVMLINLQQWTKHDVQRRALEFIGESDTLQHPLQEIMNTLLYEDDKWTTMSPEYNAMVGEWVGTKESQESEREFDPKIIHFCGPAKPWLYLHDPPYNEVWWKHLNSTPYRYHSPRADTFGNMVLKRQQRAKKIVSSKIEPYPMVDSVVRKVYNKFF